MQRAVQLAADIPHLMQWRSTLRERLRGATLEDVRPAVDRGLATSGVTVGKAGAYAPSLDEL